MQHRLLLIVLVFVPAQASSVIADVVVIVNRSGTDVAFTAAPVDGETQADEYAIKSWNVVPVPTRGRVDLSFQSGRRRMEYRLDANSAYYFRIWNDQLDLQKIGLGGNAATQAGREIAPGRNLHRVEALPVKILVDDDQRRTRIVWERRLRKRLRAASEILEKHFRVRLQVVGVETWDSDDAVHDFKQSLAEFVREVDIGKARIAIGFTSQYQTPRGKTHLGGTRGPLDAHILIREWSQHISEAERLEVLLHELGHFLGAAHSPEPDSVMRPTLGDRRARRLSFRLGFDAVNTLAAYLVTEEIRLRNVKSFSQLSTPTMVRLRQIYAALARSQPDDPIADKYRTILNQLLSKNYEERFFLDDLSPKTQRFGYRR